MMYPEVLVAEAHRLLAACRRQQIRIATAESCTGGLIAGLLTECPGSSDVIECGFVTYSNAAKMAMLDVPAALIASKGAVSEEVTRALAEGALMRTQAQVSIAVTGVAGPGGGSAAKPVGLVHLAAARRERATQLRELHLGNIGRARVRMQSVEAALALLWAMLQD